jgi:hypothetical protein
MKIFNIAENFRMSISASLLLYVGIIIMFFSLFKFADPATYSVELRKKEANKRYYEASKGKTTNTLTSSDYSKMESAIYDEQHADESPIGFYFGFMFGGGVIALAGYKGLTKISNEK